MISVCIATYNGERFIQEQIRSILDQIHENDEIVISDDGSKDRTISILEKFNDSRIRIYNNNGPHGPVGNFENALRKAKGDFIFLADQDDIWLPTRVKSAIKLLGENSINCVICNRIILDKDGKSNEIPVVSQNFTKQSFYKNLLHNPYIGCCMAFTREHLELVLPFPKDLPMHDLWIGLLAHKQNSIAYIPEPLIGYRRHGGNVTSGKSPYSIFYRIFYRISLLIKLYKRLHRSR